MENKDNAMYGQLDAVDFQDGKTYRMKVRRTTVDFVSVLEGMYEIRSHNRGKNAEARPWTTRKDLPGAIRNYAGYPDSAEGITITDVETGKIVFPGS